MEKYSSIEGENPHAVSQVTHNLNVSVFKKKSQLSIISLKSPLQHRSISSRKKSSVKSKIFPNSEYQQNNVLKNGQ